MLDVFFQRILEVIRLSTLKLAPKDFDAKAVPLLAEAKELSGWLVDPEKRPPVDEIQEEIDSWVSHYLKTGSRGAAQYTDLLKKGWLDKVPGRTVTRRLAAIAALEARLADPNLTWEALAQRFYPTAKNEVIDSPMQALRQEVIALRKILKKYGVPGSAPVERARSGAKTRKPTQE
jgi:hypothetical protein